MAKYFNCGFMRVQVLEDFAKIHYTRKSERFKNFTEQFDHVTIEEKHFHRKSQDLHKFCRKHCWWGDCKTEHASRFSIQKWDLLTQEQRIKHTIGVCQECSESKNNTFPATGQKKKVPPIPFENQTVDVPILSPEKRRKKEFEKAAAETFVENASKAWASVYKTPLKQMIPKVTNLTPRKSYSDKRKLTRERQRKYRRSIEDIFKKKDALTLYGTRESASGYEKRRKNIFLEPKKTIAERALITGNQ